MPLETAFSAACQVIKALVQESNRIDNVLVQSWQFLSEIEVQRSHDYRVGSQSQCILYDLSSIDGGGLFNYRCRHYLLLLSRLLFRLRLLLLLFTSLSESRVIRKGFLVHLNDGFVLCHFLENTSLALDHIGLFLVRLDFTCLDLLLCCFNFIKLLLFVPQLTVYYIDKVIISICPLVRFYFLSIFL